ncbi:endothelin-converting enzyme/putative endopeptidase [Flavobacterium limicola]|uniref:Endothelin-converting enzyme/putative endopeptidase n=1 Tax=Flavobacterium limicola TaxID=180441 RepID=A0A495S4H6_9FLAO|nr:M13 family metallopeptidase [Flavobacterium limicola]RKS94732.1 endothelin-converting enzyme/putative endopeptidase [Flavobacterium limicola]
MKKTSNKQLLFVIPAIMGFAVGQAQNVPATKEPGINVMNIDKKVKPSDDFFRYVNGTWLDKTEIPSDRTSWGSFNELLKKTDKDAMDILKEASRNPIYKSDTDQGKAINLFKSILDTVARDKQGITPLKPYLVKIDAIKNTKDLQKVLVEMEPIGGIGFFGLYVSADDKNSSKNSLYVGTGSLGLPDKDYYSATDKDSKEKREKYEVHVARMLQFVGENPVKAKESARKIVALETVMSAPRLDRVEQRDGRLQYNPMTVAELQKITPAIDWQNYFTDLGFTKLETVIVTEPRYMKALQAIMTQNKIEDWKAYMKWTILRSASGQLSSEIEVANFDFYGKTLTGAIKQRPREDRALQTVNGTIGEALGKLYVEKMFPAEAKVKAEKMIKNVVLAYQNRINNLTWMSAETKVKAIEKLNKITIKIGYPDKWKDYSALKISSTEAGGSYFENVKNLNRWSFNEDVDKLYKPVDKTEWGMSPQTVNAYYNPSYNEIVFPAAILQPPFYNYQADEAVNYGGIGAVIGHEISHGFDDSGARYNADGNLVDWWTANDLKQFTDLGTALADQYSALEPLPGIHVDGKFTLGENIGDLGGVNAAYDGLQLYLKANGKPGLIDGYTPEQRFFISWATVWRTKMRDEAIKNQVKTDPHSPGMYRAYVPVQNVDAFYDAFGVKSGDGMYIQPEKRVKIW